MLKTLVLSLLAATACSAPRAPASPSEPATNKQLVDTMLRAWSQGDRAALQRLLTDDVEWTITGHSEVAGVYHGRDELNAKVLTPFGQRFASSPDAFRPRTIHAVFADGATVVVHFDGAGVTNDGATYANSYVWLLTLRDRKVIRVTAFFDAIAFNALWRRPA